MITVHLHLSGSCRSSLSLLPPTTIRRRSWVTHESAVSLLLLPFLLLYFNFPLSTFKNWDIDHDEQDAAYNESPDGISHSSLLLYNQYSFLCSSSNENTIDRLIIYIETRHNTAEIIQHFWRDNFFLLRHKYNSFIIIKFDRTPSAAAK